MQGLYQAFTLAVAIVFAAQPSACIACASLHNMCKTCWFAKGIAALQQAQCGGCAQAGATVNVSMFARHYFGQLRTGLGYTQALADIAQKRHAAHFMADMAGPLFSRGSGFAQIVHQAGKAHFQRRCSPRSSIEHQPQVNAGVDFGMVLYRLRHAPQSINFWKHKGQCAAVAQDCQHARGLGLHQPFGDFLPNPLSHQMLHFARLHHVAHKLQRRTGHVELGKARRKTRQPQNADRVFAKCIGAMAQYTVGQILRATEGVDKGRGVNSAIRAHRISG